MITKNIKFKNFISPKKKVKIYQKFKLLLKQNNPILNTLTAIYDYSYKKKIISKFRKYKIIRIIGMGGSILGSQAIYDFLKFKIKKNFFFY